MNMQTERILDLQTRLNELGYGPLTVDGIYGKQTQAAYHKYLDHIDPDTPTVTPDAPKPWWTSRALLGLLASFLAMVAGRFGLDLDDESLTRILFQATELVGLVVALWGTITRRAPIDPTLVARVGSRDVRLPVPAERPGDSDDPRGVFRDS